MVTASPPSRRGLLAFLVTALGTLPYLILKVQWLSGGDAGVRPQLDMHSPSLTVANLITLVLDAIVIALAWTLTVTRGMRVVRLVAPLVWGATGLMAIPVLTYLVVIVTDPTSVQGADLDPWVYAAVYGSFAAQASGLLALLLLRMHRPRVAQQRLRTRRVIAMLAWVAVGAWYLLRAAGVSLIIGDPAALSPVARVSAAVTGALALGSALSVPMMARSVRSQWVALSWVSSGAMACFSGYLLLINLLTPQQPDEVSSPLLVATSLAGAAAAVAVRGEFHRRLAPKPPDKSAIVARPLRTRSQPSTATSGASGQGPRRIRTPDVTQDEAGPSDG